MKKEEIVNFLDEINYKDNGIEMIDNAIGTLMLDPIATKSLINQIRKTPALIRETIYWNKFYLFVKGIKQIQDELGESVRLSNKLFDNIEHKQQNGMRLLAYVDKADSEQKINYFVNATRSLLMNVINNVDYFRIMKAISETLNEDLEYLSEIATSSNFIKGNMQLLALERSGLVLQAGIDANENIESQSYAVSTLGRMVDRYAISLVNESRWRFYNKEIEPSNLKVDVPVISNKDIDKLFN